MTLPLRDPEHSAVREKPSRPLLPALVGLGSASPLRPPMAGCSMGQERGLSAGARPFPAAGARRWLPPCPAGAAVQRCGCPRSRSRTWHGRSVWIKWPGAGLPKQRLSAAAAAEFFFSCSGIKASGSGRRSAALFTVGQRTAAHCPTSGCTGWPTVEGVALDEGPASFPAGAGPPPGDTGPAASVGSPRQRKSSWSRSLAGSAGDGVSGAELPAGAGGKQGMVHPGSHLPGSCGG